MQTTSLKSIVRNLSRQAEDNIARAYAILGARPGPGLDLLIKPEEPITGLWYVTGKTKAGEAFVEKFWTWQPLTNQKLAEMKKQAVDWGLTYRTLVPVQSLTEEP